MYVTLENAWRTLWNSLSHGCGCCFTDELLCAITVNGPVHFRVGGHYQSCPFPTKTFKKTLSTFQTSDMIWNSLQIWLLLRLNTNVIIYQSKPVWLWYSVYELSIRESHSEFQSYFPGARLVDRTNFGLSYFLFFFLEGKLSIIHILCHHLIFHWTKISWEVAVYF